MAGGIYLRESAERRERKKVSRIGRDGEQAGQRRRCSKGD
jgi:hypothetical protein